MSKHSKRRTTPSESQADKVGRPSWLLAALLALAGIAIVSGLVWLVQRDMTPSTQIATSQSAPAVAATVSGPRIAVDQERFDYGDVKLNSTIETTVRVKNTGDQALALDQNPVVELIEGC